MFLNVGILRSLFVLNYLYNNKNNKNNVGYNWYQGFSKKYLK